MAVMNINSNIYAIEVMTQKAKVVNIKQINKWY